MKRRATIVLVMVVTLMVVSTGSAFALVNSSAWYTYYAPGGWTYNAPATKTYNCLAYALGYTDRWYWPDYWGVWASEGEVDSFMSLFGKVKCASTASPKIIAYGYVVDIRHFGKVTSSRTTIAKWGQLERFTHNWAPYRIDQSNPLTYGAPQRYYK